jgi:hypothetical protein
MRNKLSDLNDYLFAQIELLDDENLKGEDLKQALMRVKGINDVAGRIVANANLILKAHLSKNGLIDAKLPKQLTD